MQNEQNNPFQPTPTDPGAFPGQPAISPVEPTTEPVMPAVNRTPNVMMDGISPIPSEPAAAPPVTVDNFSAPNPTFVDPTPVIVPNEETPVVDTFSPPVAETLSTEPIIEASIASTEKPIKHDFTPNLSQLDEASNTETPVVETKKSEKPKRHRKHPMDNAFESNLDAPVVVAAPSVDKPKKSRKSLPVIIILAILALAGIGAAVYFYMQASNDQKQMSDKDSQISSLQQQLSNATSNSSEISDQVTTLQDDKKKLQDDLTKAQADLKTAQEELDKTKNLSTTNQQLTAQNQTLQNQVTALQDRVNRLIAELQRFTTVIPG